MTFEVFVPGIPKAQARAKAFVYKKGGAMRVGHYDPETSRDWKRTVLDRVATEARSRDMAPTAGPIGLELVFTLTRPKSLPKRVIYHTRKPDVDNLAKAVKDAMKGVVYGDDSQVVSLSVAKGYGLKPGVYIYARSFE